MPNRLSDVRADIVSFVDRAATRDPQKPTEPRRFLLFKREDGNPTPALPAKGESDMDLAETQAALEKAEKDREVVEKERDEALTKAQKAEEELEKRRIGKKGAKPAPATDGDDDDDEDELAKADLPPAVRARLEKAERAEAEAAERIEKAEKEAQEASEIAKAEREQRVTREFIEKAEKELPRLGEPETVGKRLKTLSETLEKADYDKYLEEQKAINGQLEKAASKLFGEYGRGGQPPASSNGMPDILAKAEELEKADPNLSSADAFRRAAQDPTVQAQYARERDATRA